MNIQSSLLPSHKLIMKGSCTGIVNTSAMSTTRCLRDVEYNKLDFTNEPPQELKVRQKSVGLDIWRGICSNLILRVEEWVLGFHNVMIPLMIRSCHDVILYTISCLNVLVRSRTVGCSCGVFYYLGTQLHGNQSIQYCAYGEISTTAYHFVQLYIMML